MTVDIDWGNKVIFIPKDQLEHSGGDIYKMDINQFRLALKDQEDSVLGMVNPDTHIHYPPVQVGGITLARVVQIINGDTVTFEDGVYAVDLYGANSNIGDVLNLNSVSVRIYNSAGLIYESTQNDLNAPVWDSAVGITDAYQNNDAINISWGSAHDESGVVKYNIYIDDTTDTLFTTASFLATVDGNSMTIRTEADGFTPLRDGVTYYIGVRAVDAYHNETTNTNYLSVTYSNSDILTLDNIAERVWIYNTRELTSFGNLETMLNALLDVEMGNWKIVNNQMVFYKRDGTELMRFNLFDKNGQPSETNVFERRKV